MENRSIKSLTFIFKLFLAVLFSSQTTIPNIDQAREILKKIQTLNPDFVVSVGTSMSQTSSYENTIHPKHLATTLRAAALQSKNPISFVTHPDRIGYFLRSLPNYFCPQCQKNLINIINPTQDKNLVNQLAQEYINPTKDSFPKLCPKCKCTMNEQEIKNLLPLEDQNKKEFIKLFQHLSPKNCNNTPNCRLSVEMADCLNADGSINSEKISILSTFIKRFGNPLIFNHHYTNPDTYPDMFATQDGCKAFENYCTQLYQECPCITHICPISQPVAYAQRSTRGTLPPFTSKKTAAELIKNMFISQAKISEELKKINPNVKILASHQWKLFKPKHTSWLSLPKYTLESIIAVIANRIYNLAFVAEFNNHQKHFDGIALSVYPAVIFDGATPTTSNCSDTFNPDEILETIMTAAQALPNQDIYIVETGCNTPDAATKEAFIIATLKACKEALEQGVQIKGLYFWGVTNDPKYYYEWNGLPGNTNFAPFEGFNIESINAAGEILRSLNHFDNKN